MTESLCDIYTKNLSFNDYNKDFGNDYLGSPPSTTTILRQGTSGSPTYTTSGSVVSIYLNYIKNKSVSDQLTNLKKDKLLLTQNDYSNLVKIYMNEVKNTSTTSQSEKVELESRNKKLLSHLTYEYCFYFKLYKKLGSKFFSLVSKQSPLTSTDFSDLPTALISGTSLTPLGSALSSINDKLKALTTLSNEIAKDANTSWNSVKGGLDTNSLNEAIQKLQNSAPTNQLQLIDAQRRAVDYSREKNVNTNMYLGIYAFLNISALAIILHIATRD